MIKLKEIVSIKTGSPDLGGETSGASLRLIKMKNIDHVAGSIIWEDVEIVKTGIRTIKRLEDGDVLVVAKGEKNTAAVVGDLSQDTIASNHFFVLSLMSHAFDKIYPPFLAWHINYLGKQYLQANSAGSVISNLRKQTLENLPLYIPALDKQKWIISTYQTMLNQKEIFDNLFKDRISLLINQVTPVE